MSLIALMSYIAVVAAGLTALNQFFFKNVKNIGVTYVQNFAGALFVFSGWVKAIDPLGTAYKMEQYFAEFESTFAGTWFDFLAPLFPKMAEYAIAFSVFTIIFEIILGILLLIGGRIKFTVWAFFSMMLFFTFLTGFTYLTGYVPESINFFRFSEWGPYVSTNMKVTDCGCFGDFIKLEPKVSFLKDVFLMIPALIFIYFQDKMHQFFDIKTRNILVLVSLPLLLLYCMSNYVWDIPHLDFRPFKVGTDIRTKKAAEQTAMEEVQVIAYDLENQQTGEKITLPFDQFMADYAKYPSDEWAYYQIKSEPAIPITKISDFDLSSMDGYSVTEEILENPNYSIMVVAYKLKEEKNGNEDFNWNLDYVDKCSSELKPFLDAGRAEGINVFVATSFSGEDRINSFKDATGLNFPFFLGDDILLKTIVRSNPGVVLLKDGVVIDKWHISKLPSFDGVKSKYIHQ
jgi:uncharacterized membrane protein YphA (DoxX/SURF4 family)/CheY-like chemotaxis protein